MRDLVVFVPLFYVLHLIHELSARDFRSHLLEELPILHVKDTNGARVISHKELPLLPAKAHATQINDRLLIVQVIKHFLQLPGQRIVNPDIHSKGCLII